MIGIALQKIVYICMCIIKKYPALDSVYLMHRLCTALPQHLYLPSALAKKFLFFLLFVYPCFTVYKELVFLVNYSIQGIGIPCILQYTRNEF